ncbi:hypothetical protein F503_01854 [Ophiostoma piceae UAMH 11346]|uniref:Uncharacterized protein n=1 Tax=Ophiostoma piceae (strain UAMH 11346) TaxID=1262450 RepID=S3BVY6_OPHP1|nr:hypothetical protein F503_01854 [Ophiostoma piceae UAMH 11346]
MKYTTPTLIFAAVAAAADVKIAWRHDRHSDETSLGVFDTSTRALVADACGSILHTDTPIDFSHVHLNGTSGYWSVGNATYGISSNPASGPACTQKYNHEFILVECTGVDWAPSHIPKALATEKECFSDVNMGHHFRRMEGRAVRRAEVVKREAAVEMSMSPEEMAKRQYTGTCTSQTFKDLYGDGDPFQSYFYKQLSETNDCGSATSCSVGQTQSVSYTIGFSMTLVGLEKYGWLSGGFDVSKTWTTGNTYTCNAGLGEKVCLWYNTAHTGYTIQYSEYNCGASNIRKYTGIMKSPNNSNRGGGYYCVVGTCRSQGDNYWEDGASGTAQ